MGQELGVKKKLKTVVTGVQYVNGKAAVVEGPKLQFPDGSVVPLMTYPEAYKHLGVWLRVGRTRVRSEALSTSLGMKR